MNALPDTPESILKDVDYCLVTHLHSDHFCADYLLRDLRIVAQNHEDTEKIRQMGFEYVTAFESESLTFGDVTIHKTKAIHVETVVLLCRKHIDTEKQISVTIETEDGWRTDKPVNRT